VKKNSVKEKQVKKVIKKVEELLEIKQNNRTITSVQEESIFISGSIVAMHSLINKDSDSLDNIPPKWIFCPLSSRSINDFDYERNNKKGDE
jgi:hypothetical protein